MAGGIKIVIVVELEQNIILFIPIAASNIIPMYAFALIGSPCYSILPSFRVKT